jgi:isomaltose glucohydrolase
MLANPNVLQRSVDVIGVNQAASGAYVACPDFRVYRFSWFRDGAFIADAMSRAGVGTSSDAFHAWCSRVVLARVERIDALVDRRRRGDAIAADELLPCRYTLDGEDAADEWWNFQLDGYGTWLWALVEHARRTPRLLTSDEIAAAHAVVRYLTAFWDEPCFDWWEEHREQRHTSTLAALYGGLQAVGERAELPADARRTALETAAAIRERVLGEGIRDGHLVKWLGGDAVDASLIACSTPFGLLAPDDPVMEATVAAIERDLVCEGGGVHRYAADSYFGGGEWVLLAGFLGWHYAEAGRRDDAVRQLDWMLAQAAANGDLPEQVSGHLLRPAYEQEWIDRWGPVATPLLWSHAMLLTLSAALR